MSFYECVFITRQDISAPDVHKLADKFIEILQEFGCKLIRKEYWGLRNLTYIINKNKKGHYVMLGIDATPQAINEFERNCKINEDILKCLSLRVNKIDEEPSSMMQAPTKTSSGSSDDTY